MVSSPTYSTELIYCYNTFLLLLLIAVFIKVALEPELSSRRSPGPAGQGCTASHSRPQWLRPYCNRCTKLSTKSKNLAN